MKVEEDTRNQHQSEDTDWEGHSQLKGPLIPTDTVQ